MMPVTGQTHTVLAYGGPNGGHEGVLWGTDLLLGNDARGTVQAIIDDLFRRYCDHDKFKVEMTHISVEGEYVLDVLSSKPKVTLPYIS